MEFNLTIDRGNSAAKMTLWAGDEPVDTVVAARVDAATVAAFVGSRQVAHAIICSVGYTPDVDADMPPEIARVTTVMTPLTPTPVFNYYGTPSTLGADRLAAAVGAATQIECVELLVVDLGTAATYDYVTAAGVFIGGNIAPGLQMRLDALNDHTARLPRLEAASVVDLPVFGRTTRDAMLNGALHGIAAEIRYYASLLDKDSKIFLTGRNAPLVAPLLTDLSPVVDPLLVGRGLNSIIHYNES